MAICPVGCISMEEDAEGFQYPQIDNLKCIQCGKCNLVCPVRNIREDKPIGGFEQKAFLVQHMNKNVLEESTSGGAFTSLAHFVIGNGGVVFGAAFDENFNVRHVYTDIYEELNIFRNSKYVQSNLRNTFQEVKVFLENGRDVLFSGTPCQIEGLVNYLGGHPSNLLLVDFVCHAIPSPLLWKKYIKYREEKFGKLIRASMRSKKKYGYQYSQLELEFDNGGKYAAGVETDPYLRAFFDNYSDRPACYCCVFKKRNRVSDITMWDCFDAYRFNKKFDDNRGVTRILLHSFRAERVINELQNVRILQVDVSTAINGVKELVESVSMPHDRDTFFKDINILNMEKVINKWFPDSIQVKIERWGRCFCEKMGIYRPVKRLIRIILGKEPIGKP